MHRERSNALYPMDFKIEAVRLLRESGKSLKEVAEDLGVSTNALREWAKRLEAGVGRRYQGGIAWERSAEAPR